MTEDNVLLPIPVLPFPEVFEAKAERPNDVFPAPELIDDIEFEPTAVLSEAPDNIPVA